MPPHYAAYDEPFLRWLDRWRPDVDYLSDAELRRAQEQHARGARTTSSSSRAITST